MKPSPSLPASTSQESLKAIPYTQTEAAEPPIPITVAKPPPFPPQKNVSALKGPNSPKQRLSPKTARSKLHDDIRRDSGLAPSSSTTRDSRTTLETDIDSVSSIRHSPSTPSFSADEERRLPPRSKPIENETPSSTEQQDDVPAATPAPLMSILTEIPTSSFEDLTQPGQVQFSNRGSMLIGGKKANKVNGEALSGARTIGSRRQPGGPSLMPPVTVPRRVLSADDEALSFRVRSLYETGPKGSNDAQNSGKTATFGKRDNHPNLSPIPQSDSIPEVLSNRSLSDSVPSPQIGDLYKPKTNELAGGIEDWGDLGNGEVDRYGFIVPRIHTSNASSLASHGRDTPDPNPGLQRMSTLLQLASDAPRRQRSSLRKASRSPARSANTASSSRPASRTVRPTSSQSSYRTINGKESKIRSAANRLPYNKDRRCVDEAGDMLTLPPGLADIAEDEEDSKVAHDIKKREWEREEKWRKMAKVVKNDGRGGGMVFEFDTHSPKVIERTWKGIPDRWRATAWHAFLTASAKRRKGYPSDEELIAAFKALLSEPSPDDVQIDIDVPRTINCHIMFRRRYRGGQRLLFRVLHCISIYFPDTGYVQGMAALAATLLCYFDEEMTFVMLVRLWQLRGLERLYQSGFEGLMQALEEFEKEWMGNGEVAAKLTELNITPTAYGTRWYLTLFNYSIPFPAQLRVWDVFMLLGDPFPFPSTSTTAPPPPSSSLTSTNPTPVTNPTTTTNSPPTSSSFNGGLDILHAVSAALIDGTREILLDSDFENAMKVLTSWIPVKDEEMLMRVARVEWKMRRRRGKG
ncbi:hypothetical protein ACLMJK_007491 [Lecanora helva]